jgi:hypothetical protein
MKSVLFLFIFFMGPWEGATNYVAAGTFESDSKANSKKRQGDLLHCISREMRIAQCLPFFMKCKAIAHDK